MSDRRVELRILRQDSPSAPSRWEEFRVPWQPRMNVLYCLMEIQRSPVDARGHRTTPVVWEQACLEEVCGSCSMLINGRPRQGCTALVDALDQPIELRPFTKFPVVRDLVVDRSRMFADLVKVQAFIHLDGTHDLGPGPRVSPAVQEEAYPLSRCMTCGCCLEACPQVNARSRSTFVGPAAINQVRLFNLHPSGAMHRARRLEAVMGPGGIADCGKAQNCVEVCPKDIPLVDSLGAVMQDTTKHMLLGWLSRERD